VLWSYDTAGAVTITATADDGFGGTTAVTFDVTLTDLPTTFDWMGVAYCANCHPDQATDWETTGHAQARQTLVDYGRGRMQYCMGCHDVGFNKGGFIDLELTPQYANVQCENCHATGVGHPANGPRPSPWNPKLGYLQDANGELEVDAEGNYIYDANYDGANGYGCGKCHTGNRHGAFPEWAKSGHANQPNAPQVEDDGTGTLVVGPPGEANCVRCHNGQFFVKIQIDGEDPPAEDLTPEQMTDDMHIVCATCHDPHKREFESQLRVDSAGTITLPYDEAGGSGTVVSAGKANICLMCHNGRRTLTDRGNQIAGTATPRGMHGNSQGPTLYGIGGFEFPGYYYDKEHPHNTWNEDKCVTCHMYTREYDPATQSPKIWGHDWKPAWEACASCHPQIIDEASYEAFKGAFQDEIHALMEEFVSLWPAPWKNVSDPENPILTGRDTDPPSGVGPPREDPAMGNLYREALWNYQYLHAEASHGVHNPDYEKQLILSAIDKLNELNAIHFP
jgi:Cytochrome c554 and c-prime/Doubled CXXCH motif (Paired_CXXCH_1)